MKTTVNFSDFCDAFRSMNRNENFSYEGKRALFDYLEEYEDSTGVELELDVIALCCEYNEDHWQDIADNYRINLAECDEDDDESKIDCVREYLEYHTQLVGELDNGCFVYGVF